MPQLPLSGGNETRGKPKTYDPESHKPLSRTQTFILTGEIVRELGETELKADLFEGIVMIIKDRCVICQESIPDDLKHHWTFGNWCRMCNAKNKR